LQEYAPQVSFLGEEEGIREGHGDLLWALDPIDGTANFVREIPLFAISLGLIRDARSILGIIDVPVSNSRYVAIDGKGAFCGSKRLKVSSAARLSDAIVAIGDYAVGEDANTRNELRLAVARVLAGRALRVRMLGSAAVDLAWLAHGKIDASITFSNKPWDTAAGVVIAREAGASVTDWDGSPHTQLSKSTIASPESLITEVIDLLKKVTLAMPTGWCEVEK
jgi:myo-inositol-1(or 4)-monophosphatase